MLLKISSVNVFKSFRGLWYNFLIGRNSLFFSSFITKHFCPMNFNMKHICKYSTYIVYLMIIFKNRYNSIITFVWRREWILVIWFLWCLWERLSFQLSFFIVFLPILVWIHLWTNAIEQIVIICTILSSNLLFSFTHASIFSSYRTFLWTINQLNSVSCQYYFVFIPLFVYDWWDCELKFSPFWVIMKWDTSNFY